MVIASEDGKWYRVSLRFMGDSLPVEELESRLGLAPASWGRKGEPLRSTTAQAKYHTNVWVSQHPFDSHVPFEKQIVALLDLLEPRLDALAQILSLAGVEGELFLGFGSDNGQGGAIFSSGLLKRVADYGLSLSLDLYPPGGDEAD